VSLSLQKADAFLADFERQFEWYVRKANWDVARRFLVAVDHTLADLSDSPASGRLRRFSDRRLKGIRSFRVYHPFDLHLVFYRAASTTLLAERLIHGARDLERRLVEPPGEESDAQS
jgi:toxin ParE1/3/4